MANGKVCSRSPPYLPCRNLSSQAKPAPKPAAKAPAKDSSSSEESESESDEKPAAKAANGKVCKALLLRYTDADGQHVGGCCER